jgi:Zn-dependent peptidase ImmA (M78 family)
MNIYKMHIEKLLHSVELTEINLPSWDVLESGSPENCANYLREYWRVPKGKIVDLTKLLEHHGIIVVQMDLFEGDVDALSMFTNRHQPIIFINQNASADRQRFNLAHELGHLLMHFAKPVSEDRGKEEEATSFASNFLMPKNDVLPNLTSLNLSKLADLKQYWKVSMAALLMRAKELGTITKNQYQYLWKQIIMNGYKKQEPVFFRKEEPSLLKEMIRLHLEELSYSESELASVLLIYEDEFKKTYLEKSSLKLVQGGSKNIDHQKVKF